MGLDMIIEPCYSEFLVDNPDANPFRTPFNFRDAYNSLNLLAHLAIEQGDDFYGEWDTTRAAGLLAEVEMREVPVQLDRKAVLDKVPTVAIMVKMGMTDHTEEEPDPRAILVEKRDRLINLCKTFLRRKCAGENVRLLVD